MIRSLAGHQRATSLILLFAALLVMIIAVFAPHLVAHSISQEVKANQEILAKLEKLSGKAGTLERENSELRSGNSRLNLLLSGETTGIVSAELQQLILNRLSSHNGRPTTIQVQSPVSEEGLSRISMSLVFQIDLKGLGNLLLDLESGTPLLFVTHLTLRPADDERERTAPTELLDVTMNVAGYFLAEGAG